MDRGIVYPGSIPLDTDLLITNRNAMVALGALCSATLGTAPAIDGLAVSPSGQGGLAVDIAPGSLTAYVPLDQSAYGSLPADLNDAIVKMGVNVGRTTLAVSAPTTSGYAITFLIQAAFQEADTDAIVLPYYNAANPAQPFLGPNNTAAAQPTQRTQRVALAAKGGVAGPAGSNQTPSPDPGWLGLATVTVAYGQTSIGAGGIAQWPYSRFIPAKLPDLRPGYASVQVFLTSGQFVVPATVSRVRATVIGGGGAGGTHSVFPSGGGGAGGWAVGWFGGLIPGSSIAVTVGGGGGAQPTPQNGQEGGSSAFGPYIAASGGQGGGGGTVLVPPPGGAGGQGYGGQVVGDGSYGGDGIPIASRGGDGGGPGSGRGATNLAPGIIGQSPGGGGGGGGSSLPNGGGTGANGGSGCNGIVIVEY